MKCPMCEKEVEKLILDKYWSDEPICKECMYYLIYPDR